MVAQQEGLPLMAHKYLESPPAIDHLPGGIPYIVGNELAERFSFYGMKTILFVFMTQHLMGRNGLVDVMSANEAQASIHWFTGAAYGLSILGAVLSDAVLGKYRTIIALSLVYCLGHLAIAVDETRIGLVLGLGLIALGAGGIKPCVSAHVGDQFGVKNQHLLSRVFQWFYFSINLGAFVATLLTPWLLARFGHRTAFGVPGVLMLLATIVFWLGRHRFVHVPPAGMRSVREAFSPAGVRAIVSLVPIYICVALFWALFDQSGSSWIAQARRMDLRWAGVSWYPSQIQAANPLLILVFIPLFSYVIYPLLGRVVQMTPLRKIGLGFAVCIVAGLTLTWVENRIVGGELVAFKLKPDDAQTLVAPTVDEDYWQAENLLDGRTDGAGWAAEFQPQSPEASLPTVVVRLRDRKAWRISSVAVNPFTQPQYFRTAPQDASWPSSWLERVRAAALGTGSKVRLSPEELQSCWASEVEVLVADARYGP
ncbi:MAG: MFS transporter, partial [Planctomycetales bacterium]|nr:MFS transporter [Planctomycetales bacterium]